MTPLATASTALATDLTHHAIVIAGLGREGLSSYRWLRAVAPHSPLVLIDDKPLPELSSDWAEITHEENVAFLTTNQALTNQQWLLPNTLVIKTPGLPLTHPLVKLFQDQQIECTSNTALLYSLLDQIPQQRIKKVGITGTKGKSTTTAFISHVLKTAGLPVVMGGNIGVPPLDLVEPLDELLESTPAHQPIWVILEQSCHQLDDLETSPQIAVIQRIEREHLDYYPTFERYVQAKSSIVRFQSSDDLVIASSAHRTAWKVASLSAGRRSDSLVTAWFDGQDVVIDDHHVPLTSLKLRGSHNIENVIPGLIIGQLAGATFSELERALQTFEPLPHRLELVRTVHDVEYVNDSLATMPEAAIAALEAFPGKKAVLLAGGYNRQQQFLPLAEWILHHGVRGLILFPPTGETLLKTLQNLVANPSELPQVTHVTHMHEAVQQAADWAQPGDVVLLSPASASFGEFKDYADRGNQFRREVELLQ